LALFCERGPKINSPNAGVITAFVRIEKRWTMVIANDNIRCVWIMVARTPKKLLCARIALKLRLPVIYLVDCSGLFFCLSKQVPSPAKLVRAYFKMNSLLSDQGVPQIAGVCGDCIAGGGYMPINL